MTNQLIVVKAARDDEAGVWFVESSDLPGLNAEAETLDALVEKLPALVEDLLEESGEASGREVPIELIAHASTRTRAAA